MSQRWRYKRVVNSIERARPSRALRRSSELAVRSEPIPQHALVEAAIDELGLPGTQRGILERVPHLHVALEESWLVVVNAVVFADCHHQVSCLAEVVPGQPWVQVMLYLELEANVSVVHPFPGGDVHRGAELHQVPLGVL